MISHAYNEARFHHSFSPRRNLRESDPHVRSQQSKISQNGHDQRYRQPRLHGVALFRRAHVVHRRNIAGHTAHPEGATQERPGARSGDPRAVHLYTG